MLSWLCWLRLTGKWFVFPACQPLHKDYKFLKILQNVYSESGGRRGMKVKTGHFVERSYVTMINQVS